MNINTQPIRFTCQSATSSTGTWTPERLIGQGKRTGQSTGWVVESMLKAKPHPELAYRAVLGLQALQKNWPGTAGKGLLRCPAL